jgi:hypothetical protein|tara:strand:- start:43 stop:303 length:261 start_codon:yes stop_codon:yes gene_type:complete
MAITKEIIISKIEVVGEYKNIQVATDTIIKENGIELSRSRHRHVINPNEDILEQDNEVQKVANSVWTDAVKNAWINRPIELEAFGI